MCVYIYHRTRVRPACACGVSEAGGPGLSKLPRIRRVPAFAPARFRADKRPGPPPREMAGNSENAISPIALLRQGRQFGPAARPFRWGDT